MKKIFKLSIICILSTLILLSSACSSTGSTGTSNEEVKSELPAYTRGVHVMDAPAVENPTEEDYLVRNGEFQYKVIVPSAQTTVDVVAKTEFSALLARALGQQPMFITDDAIPAYDENARYISLGNTTYLEKAGITFGEAEQLALKSNGVKIISQGRNIFIMGGSGNGVIYGVYDFFKICFGYEQFARTCIKMDAGVKNLPILKFNVTDIPDIDVSTYSSYGPIKATSPSDIDIYALSNENVQGADAIKGLSYLQYRFNGKINLNQLCIQSHGLGHEGDSASDAHNVLNIWSKSKEGVEAKWYAQSGYQLCHTAKGDQASYERMIDFGFEEIKKDLMRYPVATNPDKNYMYLGQEDNGGNCLCEACVAMGERDGSPAGMEIRTANELITRIRAWMDEKDEFGNYVNAAYRRPSFKMVIMAYGTSVKAPAHWDEELDKYVVNPGCEMHEDLIIQIVAQQSPSHAIYHPANAYHYEDQKAWLQIAPGAWVWNHVFYYNNLPYFADIPTCFSNERFQWWADANTSHLFNELGGGEYSQSWYDMYFYIFTKLSWDSTIPMEDLIRNFCEAYYGPAAETMIELFYEQQHYQHLANERHMLSLGTYWHQGNQFWTEEDYPYPVIRYQMDFVDKALEDIKITLDSKDPNKYYVYKERIDQFSMSIIHMVQDIYSNKAFKPYSNEEWLDYRNRAIEFLDNHKMSRGKTQMLADTYRAL